MQVERAIASAKIEAAHAAQAAQVKANARAAKAKAKAAGKAKATKAKTKGCGKRRWLWDHLLNHGKRSKVVEPVVDDAAAKERSPHR